LDKGNCAIAHANRHGFEFIVVAAAGAERQPSLKRRPRTRIRFPGRRLDHDGHKGDIPRPGYFPPCSSGSFVQPQSLNAH
jgi:hypothetical protein